METGDIGNNSRHITKHEVNLLKPRMDSETKLYPKTVRFRMNDFAISKHKASTVSNDSDVMKTVTEKSENEQMFEIRGNAIAVRKEGLKGLLTYQDVYTENERRQNSLQTSLKIFKRRVKYNEGKFIQPNESSTEDYIIHSRSPFCDNTVSVSQAQEQLELRQFSNDEHVRLLRSALQSKHNGGIVTKQADDRPIDLGDNCKNIKCSYRLPENPNWAKEVSFRDIKDYSISNVKTYVLEQHKNPCAKFIKNQTQNTVTLNKHNLSVHTSMTQVNGFKMKLGENEVTFDPRFLGWIEDSCASIKFQTQ